MALQREAVVQAAEKLVARGKIEAAIREYRKVLSEHPNDANTLNRVGDLYARLERFDEAVRFFAQIAENYTHDGFFVKAIAIYKKIIKLDPTRLDVYERLAALYHRQGLVNEARSQYQVLADYYQKHDNPASALSMYERMAELEPDNPTHHVKLAELYQQQHLTEKAMGAYRTIAELMVGHGHTEEAAQVYERALDVHAGDLHFVREAVERLRAAGAEAGAARVLAVATRKNPEARHLAQDLMAPAAAVSPPAAPPAFAEPEPPAPAAAPPAAPPAVPTPGWEDADTGPVIAATSAPPLEEFGVDLDAVAEEAAALSLPGAVTPPVGEEIELDLDEVFVLDFEEEEPPASLVRPPPDMADGRPAEAFRRPGGEGPATAYEALPAPAVPDAFEAMPPDLEEVVFTWDDEGPSQAAVAPPAESAAIDHDFLEKTAAELQPSRLRHDDDLLTEAEVLAKYGLADKATDRLLELLEGAPRHPEGLALLLRLDLEGGRHERAAVTAATLFAVAEERGDHELWQRQRGRLEAAGYRFEGWRLVAGPGIAAGPEPAIAPPPALGPAPAEPARIEPPAAAPPASGRKKTGVTAGAVDAQLAQLAAEVLAAPKRKPQPSAPPPAVAAAPPAAPAAPPAPAPPPAAADELEDSGMSWLDEVESAAPAAGSAAEDEFFDLAAELEQELLAAEAAADVEEDMLTAPREQSLEEIVEGFKRGVEENLSPEDYDTHFNLGIAYREMGLLDEAIGEFQLAAKDASRLVECCSMLGLCFLDKGLPELSIKWYKRGLAVRGLREDDMLGLLYDLGNVYFTIGDLDSAHATFVEVYGTNSNYRDVAARLEQIAAHRR